MIKLWVVLSVIMMLYSAANQSYPFLIFWGFFGVMTKLNEVQEAIEKK